MLNPKERKQSSKICDFKGVRAIARNANDRNAFARIPVFIPYRMILDKIVGVLPKALILKSNLM
jgi:hypothetical protein